MNVYEEMMMMMEGSGSLEGCGIGWGIEAGAEQLLRGVGGARY